MKNTSAIVDLQNEVIRLVPLVEQSLEELREHTRRTVNQGAALGAVVEDGRRASGKELWGWLSSLQITVREATIGFCLKALRTKSKHPDLEDVAQLQFALREANDNIGTVTVHRPPQKSRGTETGFLELLQIVSRAAALMGKLRLTQPVERWNRVSAISLRMALEPLAALHRELSKITAR